MFDLHGDERLELHASGHVDGVRPGLPAGLPDLAGRLL
jgi:hypothetical protein